jgi:lysozyme
VRTNAAGVELIKSFEKLRLDAYPDPATKGEPYTIGYGHTGDVRLGMRITEHQAEAILDVDLDCFERGIGELTRGVTLNENEFSALVSLAFNIGLANFATSTLLRRLRVGDKAGAAEQFLVWNKARVNGVRAVMPGLARRREAERSLFLTPVVRLVPLRVGQVLR